MKPLLKLLKLANETFTIAGLFVAFFVVLLSIASYRSLANPPPKKLPFKSVSVGKACTAHRHALQWEESGDVLLFVTIRCDGMRPWEFERLSFRITTKGRVVDVRDGTDIGAVPGKPVAFGTVITAAANTMDAAVASICGAGKCDL